MIANGPPEPPSPEELADVDVHLRAGTEPKSRGYDLLERFRAVPNQGLFLYTSEDVLLDRYIRQHWAALDGLTGDICDIHITLLQLKGQADAYSQLDDLRTIIGLDALDPADLPALHIWSRYAAVRVPLSSISTEQSMRDILRLVFSSLADIGAPLDRDNVAEFARKVETFSFPAVINGQSVAHSQVGGNLIQTWTQNNYFGVDKQMTAESENQSKQSMEDVKVKGRARQDSDVPATDQSMRGVNANDASQNIRQQQRLTFRGHTAYGVWAVAGLVLIIIVAIVLTNVI